MADNIWNIFNDPSSSRLKDTNAPEPLQLVFQHFVDTLKNPSYRENKTNEPSVAYKIVSSLLPNGNVSPIPRPVSPNRHTNVKKNKKDEDKYEISYSEIAAGLKLGGTLLSFLMNKRIPDMYSEQPEIKVLTPQKIKAAHTSNAKGVNAKCVVCANDLRIEARTALPCEHVFHTKCLYCCYVYQEVEKKSNLTCPIADCRREVPSIIVERIKETKM